MRIFYFYLFLQEQWSMMRTYLDTGGHCWIRWSNCPLSDLNRSNDDNLATVQQQLHGGIDGVSRHIHNIMKNITVLEGYSLKKNGKICVFPF